MAAPPFQAEFLGPLLRTLAETLEVREVFARLSEEAKRIVPHDSLILGLISADQKTVRLLALSGDTDEEPGEAVWPAELLSEKDADFFVLNEIVPNADRITARCVLRPNGGETRVPLELPIQPAFREAVLEGGVRSFLHVTLRLRGGILGGLLFLSRAPDAFPPSDLPRARQIGDCLALGLEHDRLWRAELDRRRRHEALQGLLPALAQALDIRAIFEELSRITQDVIPHDFVSLGIFTEDRTAIRIHAQTEDMGMLPLYHFREPGQIKAFEQDYLIVSDIETVDPDVLRMTLRGPDLPTPTVVERRSGADWVGVFKKNKVRSQIRVPVRLGGKIAASLAFQSRQPDRYRLEDVELAVRFGDYVALALSHQELFEQSRKATAAQDRAQKLEQRVTALAEELETLSPHRALGQSRRWRDVLAHAAKVAPTDTTVLLTGESGTGKEVVARFLHRGSARKAGPFVALNCAALPEQLLESELFGHEKGAFTGALAARAGKIEQAAGGVLFLDEVGEMSPAVQAKFLRVLQEREYERLGGSRTMKADMRVLAATNRNLKAAIAQGSFREDLYYRLAVFDIALPPLRDRSEDVPLLVEAFLEEIGRTIGRPAAGLSEEVLDKLVGYSWPGNVRELRNAIERAVILSEGGLITSEHLPMGIVSAPRSDAGPAADSKAPAGDPPASERDRILEALARAGNNQSKAARLLGLTRAQIRARIEKHGIAVTD
jgi:transcriptional regulator with GAF, ATPase, and Fis domain